MKTKKNTRLTPFPVLSIRSQLLLLLLSFSGSTLVACGENGGAESQGADETPTPCAGDILVQDAAGLAALEICDVIDGSLYIGIVDDHTGMQSP